MRLHLLTNLFLLLFAIALGTFLFVDDIDQNGVTRLSELAADSISQITIQHKGREAILKRNTDEWRMLKPVEIQANQFRIKTLLNILSTTSHAQYDSNELDLEKYALNNPETYIIFNDTRIDFGNTNPINNYRYVKIDNTLHLIDDNFYPLLSSQIGTLVARELILTDAKITKLVLPEQILSRDEKGLWQSNDEVSSDAMVDTIYQWQHKQAFSVHNYMKRESLGEIQVYLENNTIPINFNITDVEPWLIIARPEINFEYHFNIEDYDALLRPGAEKQIPEELQKDLDSETLQVSSDEFIDAIQSQ